MKKYEFTGEEKLMSCGALVKRIKRIHDGVIGGWIETEKNLDHYGNAWVYGDARVSGDAQVSGNARVEKQFDFVFISGLRFPVTVRNDGFASIGCQTKSIAEWLGVAFEDQSQITDRGEFDMMQTVLRPVFKVFLNRAV